MIGTSLALLAVLLLLGAGWALVPRVRAWWAYTPPRACSAHSCACGWGVGRRQCAVCGCPTPVRGAP